MRERERRGGGGREAHESFNTVASFVIEIQSTSLILTVMFPSEIPRLIIFKYINSGVQSTMVSMWM